MFLGEKSKVMLVALQSSPSQWPRTNAEMMNAPEEETDRKDTMWFVWNVTAYQPPVWHTLMSLESNTTNVPHWLSQ